MAIDESTLATLTAQIQLISQRVEQIAQRIEHPHDATVPPLKNTQDPNAAIKIGLVVLFALLFLSYFPPAPSTPREYTLHSLFDTFTVLAVVSMLFIIWLYTPTSMWEHACYPPHRYWRRYW